MVFAVYKDNRLYKLGTKRERDLKENAISLRLTELEKYEKGYIAKVMFLDGIDTLVPLCGLK